MAKDALILALPCVCYACMLTNSPTVNGSGNSDPFQRWAPASAHTETDRHIDIIRSVAGPDSWSTPNR